MVGLRGDRAALRRGSRGWRDVEAPVREPASSRRRSEHARDELAAARAGARLRRRPGALGTSAGPRRAASRGAARPERRRQDHAGAAAGEVPRPERGLALPGRCVDYAQPAARARCASASASSTTPRTCSRRRSRGTCASPSPHASDDELVGGARDRGARPRCSRPCPTGSRRRSAGRRHGTVGRRAAPSRRGARAARANVRSCVFDEPTEGLDEETAAHGAWRRSSSATATQRCSSISHRGADHARATRRFELRATSSLVEEGRRTVARR